jgi:RNA polymerase sigma factor (TIGR02999 family)
VNVTPEASTIDAPSPHSATELLVAWREGDDAAFDRLFEQVYDTLRRCAQGQRRRWRGNPSLQTTALVNEAYLRLVDRGEQSWSSRSHFFAVAARAMRYILMDWARRKRAQKRGGDAPTLSLEALRETLGREVVVSAETADALLVLDEALDQLRDVHPRAAQGVECRFFAGLSIEETAEALGVSPSTVSRDWLVAQGWLYREMQRVLDGDGPSDHPDRSHRPPGDHT